MTGPPPSFRAAFERTLRLSQFARRLATAQPALVEALEAAGGAPIRREQMRAALASSAAEGAEPGVALRRLRQRVMLTLAHRDLNDLAPLDEVFATMSALADETIAAAAAEGQRRAAERYGAPQGCELIVVALGKLGGDELNVSSDVDLVFLYEAEGETAGARRASHHEFFAAAGRELIALLSEPSAEGQVFRVDMRLRPFGISGPLVASLSQLEDYFVAQARPWERYAWLKARVVAGPAAGVAERVQPFVFRRYLDYGLVDSMRELHERIFEAAIQRRKADDIKVGAGGIREIEFVAQLFQMVRGGRDPALRTPSTREALRVIGERGLLEPARVAALGAAYAFLRRLEHRLQYYDDQQTQSLPRGEEHRALIAEAMGFPGWGPLRVELDRHRAQVEQAFEALFERETRSRAPASPLTAWLCDPQAAPDAEELGDQLAGLGIKESLAVARRLIDFTRSRRFSALSAGSRAKVEKLLPELVGAAAQAGGTEEAARHLIELLEAIDRREAYYALLLEHPEVLRRAARLMTRSRWVARLLARHPILLDELARPSSGSAATDWPGERAELAAQCAALRDDVERLLDHLRHYKQRQMLRLVTADLEGQLPVMALSDELSALADLLLDVTLSEAAASFDLVAPDGFCIVGYGKLGGKELGYGSDLDIIFVYDEELRSQSDRMARLAQRIITWITTHTAAGVLYETDLRLRPDGAKGTLVSSLAGFRDYQEKRAWTWEHQALTRARACAGDRALGERFERLRDELLARPRDREKLHADIVAMRNRMRGEHRADAREIKHTPGGIIDLEFCVQAIVLEHGPAHPMLRENKGNHTLLKRAGELGLIDRASAFAAADAYLAMRHRAHLGALNDQERILLDEEELRPEREAVQRLWRELFGPGP